MCVGQTSNIYLSNLHQFSFAFHFLHKFVFSFFSSSLETAHGRNKKAIVDRATCTKENWFFEPSHARLRLALLPGNTIYSPLKSLHISFVG